MRKCIPEREQEFPMIVDSRCPNLAGWQEPCGEKFTFTCLRTGLCPDDDDDRGEEGYSGWHTHTHTALDGAAEAQPRAKKGKEKSPAHVCNRRYKLCSKGRKILRGETVLAHENVSWSVEGKLGQIDGKVLFYELVRWRVVTRIGNNLEHTVCCEMHAKLKINKMLRILSDIARVISFQIFSGSEFVQLLGILNATQKCSRKKSARLIWDQNLSRKMHIAWDFRLYMSHWHHIAGTCLSCRSYMLCHHHPRAADDGE